MGGSLWGVLGRLRPPVRNKNAKLKSRLEGTGICECFSGKLEMFVHNSCFCMSTPNSALARAEFWVEK